MLRVLKPLRKICVSGVVFIFPCAICAQEKGFADPAKNFSGTAVQFDIGYQAYSIKARDLRINYSSFKLPDQPYQGSSTPYFFGLSHTFALGSQATIAAQIEVNPVNKQYVLSVLPGYALNPDVQVYAKMGLVNAQMNVDVLDNQNRVGSTMGLVAAVGAKYLWTSNWYGFVETNYIKMNSFSLQTNRNGFTVTGQADFSSYNIMVGMGYKF